MRPSNDPLRLAFLAFAAAFAAMTSLSAVALAGGAG